MAFLVTGDDTKHTSMFEWTIPPGFSTGLHVHRAIVEGVDLVRIFLDWVGQITAALRGSGVFRISPAEAAGFDGAAPSFALSASL